MTDTISDKTTGGKQIDDGRRAFPHYLKEGMSLRDWFAGQALSGLRHNDASNITMPSSKAACLAVEDADALIAALKEPICDDHRCVSPGVCNPAGRCCFSEIPKR